MPINTHARCPNCGELFEICSIGDLPEVAPIGMLLEHPDDDYHFFFFNHVAAHCGTTFVVPVRDFIPYISEPLPDRALTGTEFCEHRCTDLDDLQACRQHCRYAPLRRHLVGMRQRHARSAEMATG